MISSAVSRASAALLGAAGLALLFAPDVVMPRLVPGYPAAGLWLAQLLAAAWLGVAALDWLQRSAIIGGIYGRPMVLANLVLYFISALALLRAAPRAEASGALWLAAAPAAAMAVVYGLLLLRGPFDLGRDAPRAR